MKKLALFSLSILVFLFSCDKQDDRDIIPKNIDASDGFYVGCIHLEFEKEENTTVMIERREKGTENWTILSGGIASTSFEDNEGYTDTGMPPGVVFEYRMRNDMGDNQEYAAIEEGFAFAYVPVTEIDIESSAYNGEVTNHLTWNAGNHNSFINESEIYFNVCRSTDSLGTYEIIATVGEDRSYTDVLSATDPKDVYYRIDIFYSYAVTTFRGAGFIYETAPMEGTIHGAHSGSGLPTVNYSSISLGQLAQASEGGIPNLYGKNVDGTLYLGLLNEVRVTGYGIHELYKFTGTGWQKEWTINPPSPFNKIDFAIASTSQYVAGINDSLGVYQWDGSAWGTNLAADNLGQADAPSALSIEVDGDNLYMAIKQHPNYDLQVLKYNGSTWDAVGGDGSGIIASGSIYDLRLEKLGGKLYLRYRIDQTQYIKHLEGSNWVSDLSWANDDILSVQVAATGSEIYFSIQTNNSGYFGGVYQVTSTSTVDELILGSNDAEESFRYPGSLSVDAEGNLIVVSMGFNTATSSFYPRLNLYDGSDWSALSGEYTDGIDPAVVTALGTDLIYVYGDGASENASGEPTIIQSKKLTKQ